ncbi:MAG: FmdE family protein, partial [Armatimonadota bacterium]
MVRTRCLLLVSGCVVWLLAAAPRLAGHPLAWHGKAVPTAKPQRLSPEQELERLRQFHGHVGPYAVLGYRIGRHAVQELEHQKYFGIR